MNDTKTVFLKVVVPVWRPQT